MKELLKFYFRILKQIVLELGEDRIMKKSASLTYYTIFSLSPLVLILISAASLFFKKDAIENHLYYELKSLVGSDVALAVQNFVENSAVSGDSSFALYIGIGVLLFGATTMFTDMQDSLNLIFRVELVTKQAWLAFLIQRGLSFVTIMALGLLLVATVILNSVLVAFGSELLNFLHLNDQSFTSNTLQLANNVLIIVVSIVIFYIFFKILPDANVPRRAAFSGAVFTAILFFIAKNVIGIYIANSRYSAIFGSAASFVFLLLWIYYVVTIIFIGAKFTKVYAEQKGYPIIPSKNAKIRNITFTNH